MNRLSTVTLSLIILLTACTGGHQEQQEDELSAFGTYVYQLDTVKLTNNFALEAKRDTSRWAAGNWSTILLMSISTCSFTISVSLQMSITDALFRF